MQPQPQYQINPRAVLALVALLVLLSRGAGPVVPPGPANGPRVAAVVRESSSQTPEQGAMVVGLRNGNAAKWLADRKHALLVIDPQDDDPIAARITADMQGKPLPALAIYDQPQPNKLGKLIAVEPLRPDSTADNVTELITRHGG